MYIYNYIYTVCDIYIYNNDNNDNNNNNDTNHNNNNTNNNNNNNNNIYIYNNIYIWDKLVSFVCNCTYEKPSVPGEGDSGRSIQETYFFMHPPARRRAREDTGREPTGTDMDLKDAEVAVFSFTTIRMR